ncbi:DUF6328 family protein [Pedococcus sp. 5OH_020]|uniref:DUF6328 family protein n=1 Tax=Pedococcus sp. 5OH_020 TaxID=2989814 RepID=UPI0022E9B5E0|nr:DUF6328 family protein [Pedococcus sp. 5OH_020]
MDSYDRDEESPAERIDRNWEELLQELRVAQTGVQILTGFLLTLPLQPTFPKLTGSERWSYVFAITMSIIATCLLIGPVAMHRALFRRRRKETLVEVGHRVASLGLGFLAAAIIGVVDLTFSIVFDGLVGAMAAALGLAMFLGVWVVLPLTLRRHLTQPEEAVGGQ